MDRLWPYFLGGFLNLVFWTGAMAISLWLTRKYLPRAEDMLFKRDLFELIATWDLRATSRLQRLGMRLRGLATAPSRE
jgi:hypothetical protein